MNGTNFMIGDWVQMHNGPAKVVAVSKKGEIEFIDKFGGGYGFGADGIPLTREILEKNGLNEERNYFKEDESYLLEIHFEGGMAHWTINCNEYEILTLKFVHELQHAMRLCGIYKEIKL